MNENAEQLIAELSALPLLSRCGIETTEGNFVSNWNDAVVACGSAEWETVQNKMANEVRHAAAEVSRESYNEWNEYVSAIKPVAEALIREAVERAPLPNHHKKAFAQSMEWDVTLILMNAIYRLAGLKVDEVRNCYLEGRFACGWQGEYPSGELIKF